MKFDLRSVRALGVGCMLSLAALSASAEVLFSDDFESGDFSHTTNGARWISLEKMSVSSAVARTGSYAGKFHFQGSSDLAADAWSELRFDLGKLTPELWIQFDLYIPSNFTHRTPIGPANDKFLRLWAVTYDDIEKIGMSRFPVGGYSGITGEWDDKVLGLTNGGGVTQYPPTTSSGVTAGDLGKWVRYKIYAKAATSSTNATMKLWKNDALILDASNKINNYRSGSTHGFRYGYLLGWSNAGFNTDTDFYIDNVTFATQEADLGSSGPRPNPPAMIRVE